MAYLSKDDYTLSITLENLQEILDQAATNSGRSADQVLAFAESYARGFVTSKIKAKYNIAGEYAKDSSASDRDIIILKITIDLVLCTVHNTVNPRDIPELRKNNCDAAVLMLDEIRKGDMLIDVPVITDQVQKTYNDSQIKFISKEYTDASLRDNTSIPGINMLWP